MRNTFHGERNGQQTEVQDLIDQPTVMYEIPMRLEVMV